MCSDVNMKSMWIAKHEEWTGVLLLYKELCALFKLKILHVLTLVFVLLFLPQRSDVVEGVIPEDMVEECTNKRQELIGT